MKEKLLERFLGWLNYCQPSFLKPHSQMLLEQIKQKKDANDWEGVRQLADKLCVLCDREQKAEALVGCAVVMYEIGDFARAIDFLREARKRYFGDRHRIAVVQWLNGLILWQLEDRDEEAIKSWLEAIKCFEWLASFCRNDPEKYIWYELHISDMRAYLERAIKDDGINFLFTEPK